MFCQNCGKEISENAKFCANCGTKVDENFTKQDIPTMSNLSNKLKEDRNGIKKRSSVLDREIEKEKIVSIQKIVLDIFRSFSKFLWIVAGLSIFVIPICAAYYRINEETRSFGHSNVSVYYNTSKYGKEKIDEILNSYGGNLNAPTDVCLYFGSSKTYVVGITNALLLAKVEAYCYGDNDYQETLFNEVYSNYNDAKEKFDSLCKEYKNEITWKFWKW